MPRLPLPIVRNLHRRQTQSDDDSSSQSSTIQPLPIVVHQPEPQGGVSTVLVIQILIGVALLIGISAFLVQRRRRYAKERRLAAQRLDCVQISAPNGLDPGAKGNIPPTYQEALRSPAVPVVVAEVQQQPPRQSQLMDECMRAVYAQEEQGHQHHDGAELAPSPSVTSETNLIASPTRAEKGRSMTRWLRNQRWIPGPLSSNPSSSSSSSRDTYRESCSVSNLPVPPSPSYNGLPSTPRSVMSSAPNTPMSASHLAPNHHASLMYPEPLGSARSTAEESRLSIRASIPNSVLYPSPLQPAPRGRRSGEDLEAPPPEYEPRR